jgi:hypothetical protein
MERPALKRLLKDIKTGKVRIVVVYKIPWGVDSDQFWGQTGVANPLNSITTPKNRPLSERILAQFSTHWNSAVQPG